MGFLCWKRPTTEAAAEETDEAEEARRDKTPEAQTRSLGPRPQKDVKSGTIFMK